MKQSICLFIVVLTALTGCNKQNQNKTSGTVTIDNLRYSEHSTYALHGFSFSKNQIISTESVPGPEVIVDTLNSSTIVLQANNLLPSFAKAGEFSDENAAIQAFNNLKTITNPQWVDFTGPVLPNQVWLYRSGADTYAKMRIVSTIIEKRENLNQQINYCECTFDWVYQPNGTQTFP